MSEYFLGESSEPLEPPIPGQPPAEPGSSSKEMKVTPELPSVPTQVRFGIPFNGVVPIWHKGTLLTWHRPTDGTDLADVLGLGLVETEAGPSATPPGWSERVEIGMLIPPVASAETDGAAPATSGNTASDSEAQDPGTPSGADASAPSSVTSGTTASESAAPATQLNAGPTLMLRAADPTGRHAVNDAGTGAQIPLSAPLDIQEAMGASTGDFDITGFSIHIARLMLRAARDQAIMVVTLRAPNDPEAHHLLSMPAEVEERPETEDGPLLHFHLGTLLEVETGAWEQAEHAEGMALLDWSYPYNQLIAPAEESGGEMAFDVERLIEMAQPVLDAILQPGFPFALGVSFVLPDPS